MTPSILTAERFDLSVGKHEGFVIAGATGLIADHTLQGLARLGILPLALTDNNPALQGTLVRDIPVMSPAAAVEQYPNAAFVAAIFTHSPLRAQLSQLGATRVVSYAPLFHKFPEVFLPYFAVDQPGVIADQEDMVRAASEIWADAESRELYSAIVNWFVTLDSDRAPPALPADEEYFPPVLELRSDEVFVDCGAFDGDTVARYIDASNGNYDHIFALEPDPHTFAKLSRNLSRLDRVTALNAAAGSQMGSLRFYANGLASSHVAVAGAAGLSTVGALVDVDMVMIDSLRPSPTYVKMDIEGSEQQALSGGQELLRSGKTAFAITLYHNMSDLWQLPLFVHKIAPDLKLFLRHYAEDWAETVCYAIPANRVINSGQ